MSLPLALLGALAFLLSSAAGAVAACCPDSVEGQWSAQFFANRALAGAPVHARVDNAINFDWGMGAPDSRVPVDEFSVRWTRDVFFAAGLYDFVTIADDGTRVYVGDRLVLDNWREMQGQPVVKRVFVPGGFQTVTVEYFEGQGAARFLKSEWFQAGRYVFKATTDTGLRMWVDSALVIDEFNDTPDKGLLSATADLTTGVHDLRVDYFHNSGYARVNVWWELESLLPEWTAYYYNNPYFFGGPVFVQSVLSPSFDAGIYSPGFGVNHNEFSVRWMKQAHFSAGSYRFGALTDDGVDVFVGGNPVLQALYPQNLTFHQSGPVWITEGTHLVLVNYSEFWENAQTKVWWANVPGTGEAAVSDEATGSVIRSGSAGDWTSQATGYAGHSYVLANVTSGATATAEWHMALPGPGQYEVLAYIADTNAATRAAQYIVAHSGTADRVTINQSNYRDAWVSLGTFAFDGSGSESVSLGNATGEPAATRSVAVDAMMFRPVEGTSAMQAAASSSGSAAAGQSRYTVQPGDTFYRIARRFGVDVNALMAANPHVPAPERLRVGDALVIP